MIPALSIRQPWAWLIVHGHKDIENRNWPTRFRGPLLVHAGRTMTRRYHSAVIANLVRRGLCPPELPTWDNLPLGGLVGWTHLADCVTDHPSPWKDAVSRHGFVLRDSRPIAFVPCKGQLGIFHVPPESIPS